MEGILWTMTYIVIVSMVPVLYFFAQNMQAALKLRRIMTDGQIIGIEATKLFEQVSSFSNMFSVISKYVILSYAGLFLSGILIVLISIKKISRNWRLMVREAEEFLRINAGKFNPERICRIKQIIEESRKSRDGRYLHINLEVYKKGAKLEDRIKSIRSSLNKLNEELVTCQKERDKTFYYEEHSYF